MNRRDEGAGAAEQSGPDLSLQEAAALYEVSPATLRSRARRGLIPAFKVRGRWGHEWRVSEPSLVASGLRRRVPRPGGEDVLARVVDLERELTAVRRSLITQRSRAEQANRELGQLMLENGRLRALLARTEHGAAEQCTSAQEGSGRPGPPRRG